MLLNAVQIYKLRCQPFLEFQFCMDELNLVFWLWDFIRFKCFQIPNILCFEVFECHLLRWKEAVLYSWKFKIGGHTSYRIISPASALCSSWLLTKRKIRTKILKDYPCLRSIPRRVSSIADIYELIGILPFAARSNTRKGSFLTVSVILYVFYQTTCALISTWLRWRDSLHSKSYSYNLKFLN